MVERYVKSLKICAISAFSRNKTLTEVMEEAETQDESLWFQDIAHVSQMLDDTLGKVVRDQTMRQRCDLNGKLKEFCHGLHNGHAFGYHRSPDGSHYYKSSRVKVADKYDDNMILYGCDANPGSVVLELDIFTEIYKYLLPSSEEPRFTRIMAKDLVKILSAVFNRRDPITADQLAYMEIKYKDGQSKAYKLHKNATDMFRLAAAMLRIMVVGIKNGDSRELIVYDMRGLGSSSITIKCVPLCFQSVISDVDALSINRKLIKWNRQDLMHAHHVDYISELKNGQLCVCVLNTKTCNVGRLGAIPPSNGVKFMVPGPGVVNGQTSVVIVYSQNDRFGVTKSSIIGGFCDPNDPENELGWVVCKYMKPLWKMMRKRFKSSMCDLVTNTEADILTDPPHLIPVHPDHKSWKLFSRDIFNFFMEKVFFTANVKRGYSALLLRGNNEVEPSIKLKFYIGHYYE